MMEARHIRLGLRCTAIGMAARTGRCRLRDVAGLLAETLEVAPDDAEARAAVLAFAQGWQADPQGAGAALQDFARRWRRDPDPPRVPEHDWQRRADCGL